MSADPVRQAPDPQALMASVIRLLAQHALAPCPARAATLTHLLRYLSRHSAVRESPALQAAIASALDMWLRAGADGVATPGEEHPVSSPPARLH